MFVGHLEVVTERKRTTIADYHGYLNRFATMVRHWLSDCPDLEVVGIAKSGAGALDDVEGLRPDVIVLDHLLYDIPRGSEELAPQLRERHESLGVVLVSGMPTDELAEVAHRCQADAYLSKASGQEELCGAIRRAGSRFGRLAEPVRAPC
jgi:DNA-binding NarL/FixJ family response regulator